LKDDLKIRSNKNNQLDQTNLKLQKQSDKLNKQLFELDHQNKIASKIAKNSKDLVNMMKGNSNCPTIRGVLANGLTQKESEEHLGPTPLLTTEARKQIHLFLKINLASSNLVCIK
jgi:hypothetical protein